MIGSVKKLTCLLLALWFGLVAGLAQAHATAEDLHQLEHAVLSTSATGTSDAGHEEHCEMAHCGHVVGMLGAADRITHAPEGAKRPVAIRVHTSFFVPDDIERPKWPVSTPAVASL